MAGPAAGWIRVKAGPPRALARVDPALAADPEHVMAVSARGIQRCLDQSPELLAEMARRMEAAMVTASFFRIEAYCRKQAKLGSGAFAEAMPAVRPRRHQVSGTAVEVAMVHARATACQIYLKSQHGPVARRLAGMLKVMFGPDKRRAAAAQIVLHFYY